MDNDQNIEFSDARSSVVGGTPVRRALPQRHRRTVGAWCFADHIGPVEQVKNPADAGIGPHPHIGLQTVTWLIDGELRHRDSLGSDQLIRPGQLNLMTAGNGIAHAEEWRGGTGRYHGIQLWVAQPDETRHGPCAFEHHASLPRIDLRHGSATILIGSFAGATSTARRDTDHFGAQLDLHRGQSVIELRPDYEHALIVLDGALHVGNVTIAPGRLAYLPAMHSEIALDVAEPTIAMLIGGAPFEAPISMWWNFVGRDHDELAAAQLDWNARRDRFGPVDSMRAWIKAPDVPSRTS